MGDGRKKRVLTKEERTILLHILRAIPDSVSLRQLARLFNVSHETIRRYRKKARHLDRV